MELIGHDYARDQIRGTRTRLSYANINTFSVGHELDEGVKTLRA